MNNTIPRVRTKLQQPKAMRSTNISDDKLEVMQLGRLSRYCLRRGLGAGDQGVKIEWGPG